MKRGAAFVAAISSIGATLSAAPASADEIIATVPKATAISAYGGRMVWSRFESNCPDRSCRGGAYRLVTRYRGRTATVPVRARSIPFDADLGPAQGGGISAVYSRCRSEPEPTDVFDNGLPAMTHGVGCRIFRYDFRHRRERPIHTGRVSASAVLPSLWRGRLAFAELTNRDAAARHGERGRIVIARSDGTGRRMLPGGSSNVDGNQPSGRGAPGPGPIALDLRGATAAFVWESEPTRCGDETGSIEGYVRAEVRAAGLERRPSLLAAACTPGTSFFASPTVGATAVSVLGHHEGRRSEILRVALADQEASSARITPEGGPISVAQFGAGFVLSRFTPPTQAVRAETEIVRLDGAEFGMTG